jgi:hypothetical protein
LRGKNLEEFLELNRKEREEERLKLLSYVHKSDLHPFEKLRLIQKYKLAQESCWIKRPIPDVCLKLGLLPSESFLEENQERHTRIEIYDQLEDAYTQFIEKGKDHWVTEIAYKDDEMLCPYWSHETYEDSIDDPFLEGRMVPFRVFLDAMVEWVVENDCITYEVDW